YAIESDSDSIGNANVNVRANGVADRVHVLEGDALVLLPLVAPVQLVLANIISSALRSLLPIIKASLNGGGRVILSGLLLSERAEWRELLQEEPWRILEESSEGDWWTVAIAKT
ncbi:MAG: 50S ribosomal protein L11 methyltransferase, partial [Gemmatimonadota bacterium]